MAVVRIKPGSSASWLIKALGTDTVELDGNTQDELKAAFEELKSRTLAEARERSQRNKDSFDALLEKSTVKKRGPESIKQRVEQLNAKSSYRYDPSDVVDIYNNYTTYKQAGLRGVPGWLNEKHAQGEKQRAEAARESASLVSGIADSLGMNFVTDSARSEGLAEKLAQMAEGALVQKAAAEGVRKNRKKKQESFYSELRSRGAREGQEEQASRSIAKKTVETNPYRKLVNPLTQRSIISAPGNVKNRVKSELDNMTFEIDGKNQPLPNSVKNRTMQALQEYIDGGYVDENSGEFDPKSWIGVSLGKMGLKGAPKFSSPIGHKLRGVVLNSAGISSQAAKDWEATVGKEAKKVLESDGFLEGSGQVLNNAYNDFTGNIQGLIAIADWDTQPLSDHMRSAWEAYLVQTEGGRPVLGAELKMLDEEASTQMAAQLVEGMKEGVARLFTDTKRSLAGDPFNSLATAVGLARLVNAGGIALPKNIAADARKSAAEFLSKVDSELTGIPTVMRAGKKIKDVTLGSKAVQSVLQKPEVQSAIRIAKTISKPYTAQELTVMNARAKGGKLADQVETIYEKIQSGKNKGLSERDAAIQAIDASTQEGAVFFSKEVLRDKLFKGVVDNVELMVNKVENPVAAAKAFLSDNVHELKKHISEEDLAGAGYRPTFVPRGMFDAPTVKGKKVYETVEVDGTMLSKSLDVIVDELPQPTKRELFTQAMRIKNRLRSGQKLAYPEFRPLERGGVPRVSKVNPKVDNLALLVAMVDEAKGGAVPVSILSEDKSFIMGPLAGPKEIIDAIPDAWRRRRGAEFYGDRANRTAEEMLKGFKNGDVNDYALYLKRSRNKERKEASDKAFNELESLFLESTGLKKNDFYSKTTLGGLSKNVDDYLDELVVRRSYKLPGAAAGVPSLYNIGRPVSDLGISRTRSGDRITQLPPATRATPPGNVDLIQQTVLQDLPSPQQLSVDVPVGLSDRATQALRFKEGAPRRSFQQALQEMEEGRIAKRDEIVAQMGPRATFDVEARNLVDDLVTRASKIDEGAFSKKLKARDEVIKSARNKMIKDLRDQTLADSKFVLGGFEWDTRQLKPMLFEGSPEQVASRMIEAQGEKGRTFLSQSPLEEASPQTINAFNLDKEKQFSVPGYVNDAFEWMSIVDDLGKKTGTYRAIISKIKRFYTTRSISTFANNNISNYMLRGLATGRTSPTELTDALKDIKAYVDSGRKKDALPEEIGISPERYEMLKVMDAKGVFDSDVLSAEVMDSKLSAMPLDALEKGLSAIGATKVSKPLAAYNRAMNKLEKGYNISDPVFKADHVFHNSDEFRRNLDAMEPGSYVDAPVASSYSQRIYRGEDGSHRLGAMNGNVLSDADLKRISTEQAITSANDMYFDYSNVPKMLDLFRAIGLDAVFINPFFTWAWKAMYIPFVKKGLAGQVLTGGRNYKTTSKGFQQARSRAMLANELKRQLMLAGGSSMSRDELSQQRKNRALRVIQRYNLDSPYRGIATYGANESYLQGFSGIDISGANDPVQGLVKQQLSAESLGGELLGSAESVASNFKSKLKNQRQRDYFDTRVKENPDYAKELVEKVRLGFPLAEYDTMSQLAEIFQANQSLYSSFVDHLKNRAPGETVSDAYGELLVAALAGTKDIPKAIKAYNRSGEWKDALAAIRGVRRVDNEVFNKAIDNIRRKWKNNALDVLDLETIEKNADPAKLRQYSMDRELLNAVIAEEMEKFIEVVAQAARDAGIEVEQKKTRPKMVGILRAEQIRRGE